MVAVDEPGAAAAYEIRKKPLGKNRESVLLFLSYSGCFEVGGSSDSMW